MKNYRLIKEYPGSPKLGHIDELNKTGHNNQGEYVQAMYDRNPEFWQEVVKKDYEILSVITNNNKFIEKVYNQDATIEPYWKIHSVKRLSDGEIFTIGDIIDTRVDNKYKQEILEINLGINDLLLKDKLIFKTKSGYVVSHIAVKVKQKLFTTEDGVDIYDPNTIVYSYIKNWTIANFIASNFTAWDKIFSTSAAAKDYVNNIILRFSIKDVESMTKMKLVQQSTNIKNTVIFHITIIE